MQFLIRPLIWSICRVKRLPSISGTARYVLSLIGGLNRNLYVGKDVHCRETVSHAAPPRCRTGSDSTKRVDKVSPLL
jgi:hypothetical protein